MGGLGPMGLLVHGVRVCGPVEGARIEAGGGQPFIRASGGEHQGGSAAEASVGCA
jgi:hypothetical protein